MARAVVCAAVAGAVAVGGGCGSDEPEPRGGSVEERADRPAGLPAGWRLVVNPRVGFSVGVPPGWTARGGRGTTVVRSGDRALAASVSADRSPDGQTLSAESYARRLVRELPGYRSLRIRDTAPVRGARYPGAVVTASGVFARGRVRQAIRAVALRRPGLVTYTLVFFRTARAPAATYAPAVSGMVRTFRAQPARP